MAPPDFIPLDVRARNIVVLVRRSWLCPILIMLTGVLVVVYQPPIPSNCVVWNDEIFCVEPQEESERIHVFFLKTHTCCGYQVQNLLFRFAYRRNLTLLLPKEGRMFSENSTDYWHNKDPRSEHRSNDLLSDYLLFNETFVQSLMPADTLYISMVQDPFDRFHNAFMKYSTRFPKKYLTSIPGKYPLETYLSSPRRWEHRDPRQSFTNNRMMLDFGLDVSQWPDRRAVERYLKYLESRFDLVMLADKLDESLILLRRLARWTMTDIIHIKNETFHQWNTFTFSETQKDRFRQFQYPDYALYKRFEAIFYSKISQEAEKGFYEELAEYRDVMNEVRVFCEQIPTEHKYFEKNRWGEAFIVSAEDCRRMKSTESWVNRDKLQLNYPN